MAINDRSRAPSPAAGLGSLFWSHAEDKCRTKVEGARAGEGNNKEARRYRSFRQRAQSARRSGGDDRGGGQGDAVPSSVVAGPAGNLRASYLRSFRSAMLRRRSDCPPRRAEDFDAGHVAPSAAMRRSSDPGAVGAFETRESSCSNARAEGKSFCIKITRRHTDASIKNSSGRSLPSPTSFSGHGDDTASLPGGVDTFLPHLGLGDIGSPGDMIEGGVNQVEVVSLLQNHDFAFVLRSDKVTWTYAIVAKASEESILFVVDKDGSTKSLSRAHWASCVRMVNAGAGVWAIRMRVAAALASRSSPAPSFVDRDLAGTLPAPPFAQPSYDEHMM